MKKDQVTVGAEYRVILFRGYDDKGKYLDRNARVQVVRHVMGRPNAIVKLLHPHGTYQAGDQIGVTVSQLKPI